MSRQWMARVVLVAMMAWPALSGCNLLPADEPPTPVNVALDTEFLIQHRGGPFSVRFPNGWLAREKDQRIAITNSQRLMDGPNYLLPRQGEVWVAFYAGDITGLLVANSLPANASPVDVLNQWRHLETNYAYTAATPEPVLNRPGARMAGYRDDVSDMLVIVQFTTARHGVMTICTMAEGELPSFEDLCLQMAESVNWQPA